jgi:zinc protease
MKLRPEAYKVHPYQWPTIGKKIEHIEKVDMDIVKGFFHQYYQPSNATLVLAGAIDESSAKAMTEKWFGDIQPGGKINQELPREPRQEKERLIEVEEQVPQNAIYKVFHMPGRNEPGYHLADLTSDILGRGKSSLLYQKLVRENPVFSHLSAFVTGSADPGLLVINGRLNDKVSFEQAEELLWQVINQVKQEVREEHLQKVKNLAESSNAMEEVEILNRAMGLAYADFLGDPNLVNREISTIKNVTREQLLEMARKILLPENSTTLHYKKAS